MKKVLYTAIYLFVFVLNSQAQQIQQYTQYITNPFIYNPAFAGYDNRPTLFATHRQQWLGIEGAPVTTNLIFHSPLGNKSPIAIGANINNDRFGLINNFSARFTFAYMLPLSVESEHYLKFGLAAGLGMNRVDLSEVNFDDDYTLNTINNGNIYPDGRFGIQYHFKHLNIGLTLPHLFVSPLADSEESSLVQISQMSKYLTMINYRFNFGTGEVLAFEPTLMYQVTGTQHNRIEGLGVLHIKNTVWVGGGYQQELGIAAVLGVKTQKLSIGYSYGMGGSGISEYGNGTHEIQLGFILGKKKEVLTRKPRLTRSAQGEAIPEEIIAKQKKTNDKKTDNQVKPQDSYKSVKNDSSKHAIENTDQLATQIKNQRQAPQTLSSFGERAPIADSTLTNTMSTNSAIKKDTPTNSTSTKSQIQDLEKEEKTEFPAQESRTVRVSKSIASQHPMEMKAGNYAIAGTFSQQANAEKLSQKLFTEGFFAKVGFNSVKGYYYVYLLESDSLNKVKQEISQLRNNSIFKDAWIMIVEE